MSTPLLKAAYDPENFRKHGHELIDLLADHLATTLQGQAPKVLDYHLPDKALTYWQDFLQTGDTSQLIPEVIRRTTHVHHPRFMGHQISPALPLTALTSMASSLLNNGMAVYEMGMAPSAMERVVTDNLCTQLGYPANAAGFLTSGGTLANLTALLCARKQRVKQAVWEAGSPARLALMVSEEAHYCIDRAARIMGLGDQGVIKIPVGPSFAMNTQLLHTAYDKAREQGLEVFALVGSAPSTATGIYDDLDALASFAKSKDLWLHIDAAHGGGAMYSAKYRQLLKSAEKADSIIIDGHKMMMMPAITTALLFKNGSHSHLTFQQQATYLLEDAGEEDWYNLAKRTFECTKYMMSLHWYASLKTYGPELFEDFANVLYDNGRLLADLVRADEELHLAVSPMSNIVCFRWCKGQEDEETIGQVNSRIRQHLLNQGTFYVVQTRLKGSYYLRVTLMNPFTTKQDLAAMLREVKQLGRQYLEKCRRKDSPDL